ncbi:MAG: diacylglycerol kinase family protein [Bacteroidales bacterium]|nr:diacylglycerol kinase family protein [Bacteroidales bacterium]MCF8458331.1 diacylglycerol kinase family protein [Bacteroidales bacterium]
MEIPAKEKFSFRKRGLSFKYAFRGIGQFFIHTHNAWIHLAATVAVVIAGLFFDLSTPEWLFLIVAMGMVWTTEAMNTAIEFLVNLVSPGYNKLAGTIKDIAAGAVLLAAICAVLIGLFIFIPHISKLF